ncbi:MAG: gluconokinase [Geminicoccaceae bacterium]
MVQAVVVMGVCGTGKTTVGQMLSDKLGCPFLEGDSFHPPENVEKMRAGLALDDNDRWPWLNRLGRAMAKAKRQEANVITACSALKRSYRDRLRHHVGSDTLFVLLHSDPALLRDRLTKRADHYMPPSLLDSQLAILEQPDSNECAISLDAALPPDVLMERIEREIVGA